jgi:flagellar export protein FliJ
MDMGKSQDRLDVVLRVREDAERSKRASFARAVQASQAAQSGLDAARAAAMRAAPTSGGSCGAWLLALDDTAHTAALHRVKAAQDAVHKAAAVQEKARHAHLEARTAQRMIERVIEARQIERRRDDEKREQATLDELALNRR